MKKGNNDSLLNADFYNVDDRNYIDCFVYKMCPQHLRFHVIVYMNDKYYIRLFMLDLPSVDCMTWIAKST